MKSNYAIIGPRRSGTTICFRTIRDFSNDFTSELQDEFFNTSLPWFGVKDGLKLETDYDRKYLPKQQEIQYRINLLKKHKCGYTIKLVSDQLNENLLEFIIENYKIIIIERTEKYEQFLSFIISEHTNTWGSQKPFIEDQVSMHIPMDVSKMYFNYEKQWLVYKEKLLPYSHTITYEDFTKDSKTCLEKVGIKTRQHSNYYKPIYKMRDLIQKEQLISNLEQHKIYFEENKHIWK